MRIFSYVEARFEDGCLTGVARFDHSLRDAIPELQSVTTLPDDLADDDVVIAANHMALDVPEHVRCIVVHHGCAITHYARDEAWRNEKTLRWANLQRELFERKHFEFVAPSTWVREQFSFICGAQKDYATVIPHGVELIDHPHRPLDNKERRPVVLGDWRDSNKGSDLIRELSEKLPHCEFRQLQCTFQTKEQAYQEADLYLCLSLAEGFSYAMADAEAASMPIVTTDVGLAMDIPGLTVFKWDQRKDLDVVAYYLQQAIRNGRKDESYFKTAWPYDKWKARWRELVFRNKPLTTGKVKYSKKKKLPPVPKIPRTVAVGMGGGIGNSIFNLPVLKALNEQLGLKVTLLKSADYPSQRLWARCRWVDRVYPARYKIDADFFVSGEWGQHCVPEGSAIYKYNYSKGKGFPQPEWDLNLDAARDIGCALDIPKKPCVFDWCKWLVHPKNPAYDVGIIPGCKPGEIWDRKKYPYMGQVSRILEGLGYKICILGTEQDRDERIQGEDLLGKFDLDDMPETLANCRCLLSIDNGIGHLGSSLGIPGVMIFTASCKVKGDPLGPTVVMAPPDLGCYSCAGTPRWRECTDWKCQQINPYDVVLNVTQLLREKS